MALPRPGTCCSIPRREFAAGYVHPGLQGRAKIRLARWGATAGVLGRGAAGGPRAGAARPTVTEAPLVVVRHGATEWSENGRHTGRTDLPLLPSGVERARKLRPMLAEFSFARVLCSPLQRARQTASWPASATAWRSLPIWPNGTTATTRA